MKNSATPTVLLVTLAALSALSACDDKTQPATASEQQTPTASAEPGLTSVTIDSRSDVSTNSLDMYVTDPRVQNWEGIGTRSGSHLTSNGTNGFLMFGPKVPFDAGDYQVTIYGEGLKITGDDSITFDITSDEGKEVYAVQVLDKNTVVSAGAPLTTFTFALPQPVNDLEVRAYVTSGSEVTITRYEVIPTSSP